MRETHSSARHVRSLVCAATLALVSLVAVGCAGTVSSNSSNSSPKTPSLSLSATTFDFKTVVVGQSATQTLSISNSGGASLQITGLSLSNKAFSITGPAVPSTIAPSSSLSYTLAFAPASAGSASGTLNVTSNAANPSVSVSLSGTGEKAVANIAVTPPSINFGNLAVNTTNTQNVTLQNSGNISLTVQGITLAGAGFSYSGLSPGFSMTPNQTVTFQVSFSPKVTGPASATLSFVSPSLTSPATMGLSGTGVSSSPPPAPPPVTQHTVHLAWQASSSQVIGYIVYRKLASDTSYSPLNSTPITALTYADSTVALGTTYDYAVTAVDASGVESAYSNQVTAAIPSS